MGAFVWDESVALIPRPFRASCVVSPSQGRSWTEQLSRARHCACRLWSGFGSIGGLPKAPPRRARIACRGASCGGARGRPNGGRGTKQLVRRSGRTCSRRQSLSGLVSRGTFCREKGSDEGADGKQKIGQCNESRWLLGRRGGCCRAQPASCSVIRRSH